MLPLRIPKIESSRSLRLLGRRVVQAMAEHGTANMILGERVVPSRFVVLRLAADAAEKAEQEGQYTESRDAIEAEIVRTAQSRDFRLRGGLELDVRSLLEMDLDDPTVASLLRSLVEEDEVALMLARLRTERELILPRRLHRLLIDSRPRGAAVYLNDRQLDRVTPCRLDDLPAGRHAVTLALPGHLLHEGVLEIAEEGGGSQEYVIDLEPEPPMGVLELVTFPGQATATVNGETRETPARFRVPAGLHRIEITRAEHAPLTFDYELAPGPDTRPSRVQLKLEYAGEDHDVPVGRLIVYKPETGRSHDMRPLERPEETISTFFQDAEGAPGGAAQGSGLSAQSPTAPAQGQEGVSAAGGSSRSQEPEILGERPLHKGVLVFGRADRNATVIPDVKLFDPGNTVSRGCHAWLHIYTDPGTGAEFNTFTIHNHSPGGILVDGRLVMESTVLGDESEVQIGIFRMRVRKETPVPSVEF